SFTSTVHTSFGRPHIWPLFQPSGMPLAPSLGFVQSSTMTTSAAHAETTRRSARARHTAGATLVDVSGVMAGPMIPFGRDGFAGFAPRGQVALGGALLRLEEHTSELQSRGHLVCRLLLEKKKRV